MPEIERPEMQKHTLFLYRGDYDKLRALFPENGAAVAIRRLIRNYLNEVEKRGTGRDTVNVEVNL